MKKILVPIDFSANASNALQYAASLATQTGSSLTLVHVMPVQVAGVTEAPLVVTPDAEAEALYTARLHEVARQLEEEHRHTFKVNAVCTTGLFLDKLIRLIRTEKIDLVVMGTAGASTFLDKLLGTNTLSLIRNAPCPVLAIPAQVQYTGVRRVAYASDLSANDMVFLKQLHAFALPFKPEISIVHVKAKPHLKSKTDQRALQTLANHFPEWPYTQVEVKEGDISAGILTFAQEHNIDILALALHERSLLEELFHTSVSRKLALKCPVPLLTLPEQDRKKESSGEPQAEILAF
ncbi:universal stress protein [Pontibacter beigongshangensis]|uniref:universal stress protein n=1 Tax=Pontibacter beigongshangensis TaxID=2574733 RepID=UPI00164F3BA6|nr:universal stress protein [Pontibacter beigongshangensis]